MSSADWRPCVSWLVECRIMPEQHPLAMGCGTANDLLNLLKDGVMLCQLLNRIEPRSVDHRSFSQRPQTSQYLCKKNIKVFIDTCQKKFGLQNADLFEITDLTEKNDLVKVLKTLSCLSKSEPARSKHFRPFSVHLSNAELPEFAEPSSPDFTNRNSSDSAFGSELDYSNETEDDIYDSLVNVISPMSPSVSKLKTHRELCIDELVMTEKKYVETLNTLVTCFMNPLESHLSPLDFKKIFFGIQELHEVHINFSTQLTLASAYPSETCMLSDCFIKFKDQLLVYGEFCARLTAAQELVDALCRDNPKIDIKIKECQNNASEGRFKLRDMLHVPMQRVLKYHLLLRELVKHTPDDHYEKANLTTALAEIEDLSLYVNEVKRDYELKEQIEGIEKSIIGLDMPENARLFDYGRLLRDGELRCKRDNSKESTRYVFLFDKLMLLCKAKQESYVYKDFLVMHKCKFDGNITKDKHFGVTLTKYSGTTTEKFSFSAKDEKTMALWRDAIRMAKDNIEPHDGRNKLHEFVLSCLEKPTKCDVCFKLLRGTFFRGYVCQKTKMVVHKECISKARDMTSRPAMAPSLRPKKDRRVSYMEITLAKGMTNRPAIGTVCALKTYTGNAMSGDGRRHIHFTAGVTFDLISNNDPEFWEGRIENTEGFFPAELVEIVELKIPQQPQTASAVPKHPVTYPAGVKTGRRSTEPTLPMSQVTQSYGINSARPPPTLGCRPSIGLPEYMNIPESSPPPPPSEPTGYPWYAGEMTRDDATQILSPLPNGSFMVRLRVTPGCQGDYALSVKYKSPKHVKIYKNAGGNFYLIESVTFPSLQKLVEHYQVNSLASCFPADVPTVLLIPYQSAIAQMKVEHGVLGYCEVQYDYAASEPNQLTLAENDVIAILSKAGESQGWWKGRLNGQVGYFPKSYVIEVDLES